MTREEAVDVLVAQQCCIVKNKISCNRCPCYKKDSICDEGFHTKERVLESVIVLTAKENRPPAPPKQNSFVPLSVDLLGLETVKKVYATANNALYLDGSDKVVSLYNVCKLLNPKNVDDIGKKYIDVKETTK